MSEVDRAMSLSHFAALALAFAVPTTAGFAQSPRPMPLAPGDPFPELEVYDAAGSTFNTNSLQGQHAVIVSGCLT